MPCAVSGVVPLPLRRPRTILLMVIHQLTPELLQNSSRETRRIFCSKAYSGAQLQKRANLQALGSSLVLTHLMKLQFLEKVKDGGFALGNFAATNTGRIEADAFERSSTDGHGFS